MFIIGSSNPAWAVILKIIIEDILIAYEISKGSPLKNHRGEMYFSGEGENSKLVYTIRFEPKVNFPMWGGLLSSLIEKPIRKGFKEYAEKL